MSHPTQSKARRDAVFDPGNLWMVRTLNRRRHRLLRPILPDPPGSAAAIPGQHQRAATIKRWAAL